MCGAVGYIGKNLSRPFVIEGLSRLEYRGYDSAGFACLNPHDNRLLYVKTTGKLDNLTHQMQQQPIDGFVGIGHTRWSTHGVPSAENAHPHFDCNKTISLVHNGIIENHHALRTQLTQEGHIFHSQTDTETIAHLFESLLKTHVTFKMAIVDLVRQLEGAYAFLSILQDRPDVMIAVRKRSPLCIGIGESEMFVASDVLAFVDRTQKVLFLPDESFALVYKDRIELYDFSGTQLPMHIQELAFDWQLVHKSGFEHFMLKEIYEQKKGICTTVNALDLLRNRIWDQIGLNDQIARNISSVHLISCGTSWHASCIAQSFFEMVAGIVTYVHLASEFRYRPFFPQKDALYIFVSQSGETADTLESLRMVNQHALATVALTNVASSSLVREAQGFFLTQAGHEIAVASTKAFSTQLAALYWFVHRLAAHQGKITAAQENMAFEDILVAAQVLENSIENYKHEIMHTHAQTYAQYKKAVFLGRHVSYPFALEAALKLKEISYIFSQAYPAGELKHGPLALIDASTPVFLFSHTDPIIYQKLLSNAHEVKARSGHIIAFVFEGQHELACLAEVTFTFPSIKPLLGPLCMTGVMQFLAYHIARVLGCSIDKPRNLAKSVTVE